MTIPPPAGHTQDGGEHHQWEQAWQQEQQRDRREPITCGPLLTMADPALESAFWEDVDTVRAYAAADKVAVGYILLAQLLVARQLCAGSSWDVHVIFACNTLACLCTLGFLLLANERTLLRHRHALALANRLLRLAGVMLTAWVRTRAAHMELRDAVVAHHGSSSAPGITLALLLLSRPLNLTSLLHVGHGAWHVRMAWWFPLQLLTFLLAAFGTLRFQPCVLANDALVRPILQPTVDGMGRLHETLLSIIMGSNFQATAGPTPAAASTPDLLTAARVLSFYHLACFLLIGSVTSLLNIEFELKSRWAKKRGRELVYSWAPWLVCASSDVRGGCLARLNAHLTVLPAALWLLWLACLALVPRLPSEPCVLTADASHSRLEPCDGWVCADPGLASAVLLYAGALVVYLFQSLLRRAVML